jgi:hypothetical protein
MQKKKDFTCYHDYVHGPGLEAEEKGPQASNEKKSSSGDRFKGTNITTREEINVSKQSPPMWRVLAVHIQEKIE